jgi:hypothetical protein
MNTPPLVQYLRRPEFDGLSDAEALRVLLSPPPNRVRRSARMTFATIGGIWGATRAAGFKAWLKASIAGGGELGAVCDYVLGLLDGPGFDPANEDALAVAMTFVAAKGCSQREADGVLYEVEVAPFPDATLEDVATARAFLAREAAAAEEYRASVGKWNAYSDAFARWGEAGYPDGSGPQPL